MGEQPPKALDLKKSDKKQDVKEKKEEPKEEKEVKDLFLTAAQKSKVTAAQKDKAKK